MKYVSFKDFFRVATEGREPYPYQEEFATSQELPHLVRAPTGAGKKATAILGWLWRWHSKVKHTPRRLIYCLPMRVLVEQSHRETFNWLKNLGLAKIVGLHQLMGGVELDDWFLHPEQPAVLIGTQDMLLSRALNRGYAESRFHWPIDFGLLNNDCLWVFDEPQLMASGVTTSAQMHGLRTSLNTFGSCHSVWMSATLEKTWLDTIDFVGKFPAEGLELRPADYDAKLPLHKRMTATKILVPLGVTFTKEADDKEAKAVAAEILKKHCDGTQTLVISNTVRRAKAVYKALNESIKKSKNEIPRLLLVHSRFRPNEREKLNAALQEGSEVAKDRIIISTQVVEAGVDISARTLITELAPWASIVQRIGRCNRTGDDGPGQVFWIDLPSKLCSPYEEKDLELCREYLRKLESRSVSPKDLDSFKIEAEICLPFEHKHVLRRKDLLDLFDTSPDLSGNDIDISRFVRSDDPDTDVQVFWREVGKDGPKDDIEAPHRQELCNVPVGDLKTFLEKADKRVGFYWDHIDEEWRKIRDPKREIRPGLTVLLPSNTGGYSQLGWDPDSAADVPVVEPKQMSGPEIGTGNDNQSSTAKLTLEEHTDHVCDELDALLTSIFHLPDLWPAHLQSAARWHDLGKVHWAFQEGVRGANPSLATDKIWAKSGSNGRLVHGRKHFRHELVSALASLNHGKAFEIAYLIAAHHGKVRLSIRTLPKEDLPDKAETLFALGVHDGDALNEVELGHGEKSPATTIDLSPMKLGGKASWTGQALDLLQKMGPFKLAYLEALLRAADLRASAKERMEKPHA